MVEAGILLKQNKSKRKLFAHYHNVHTARLCWRHRRTSDRKSLCTLSHRCAHEYGKHWLRTPLATGILLELRHKKQTSGHSGSSARDNATKQAITTTKLRIVEVSAVCENRKNKKKQKKTTKQTKKNRKNKKFTLETNVNLECTFGCFGVLGDMWGEDSNQF